MNLKSIVTVTMLAISGVAQAAPVYQSPVTFVDPEFAIFAKGGLASPFDLFWDFTLSGGPWSVSASVTSAVNGTKDVDFTRVFLTDGTTEYDFVQTAFDIPDLTEQWSLAPIALASDVVYRIHTLGTATGRAAFAGELQLTAAVPEPSTFTLLLAGLAAAISVGRRRKAIA